MRRRLRELHLMPRRPTPDSSAPVELHRESWGISGLCKIWYLLEDRRPDLSEDEAQEMLGYKYKQQITVELFWIKEFSWVFHSLHMGYFGRI